MSSASADANWRVHRLQMLNSGDFSDCTFLVGSDNTTQKEFKCNKLILSVASSVFHTMFYGSLPEKCDSAIPLPDVDPVAFRIFLEYIYCASSVNLSFHSMKKFDKLCYIADKYMVQDFRAYCEKYLVGLGNSSSSYQSTGWQKDFTFFVLENCVESSSALIQHCLQEVRLHRQFYMKHKDLLKTSVKTFTKVIDVILDCLSNAGEKEQWSEIFTVIDEYALRNNFDGPICKCHADNQEIKNVAVDGKSSDDWNDQRLEDTNYFRDFFLKALQHPNINKRTFYWGAANSKLLCKTQGFDMMKKLFAHVVEINRCQCGRTFY